MNISAKRYATTLADALNKHHGASTEVVKAFAQLLIERGESGKLRDIERAYESLRRSSENELDVTVVSGQALGAHLFPKELNGKKVREEHRVDANEIAGARISIEDSLVDNTIARRLRDLRNALS